MMLVKFVCLSVVYLYIHNTIIFFTSIVVIYEIIVGIPQLS